MAAKKKSAHKKSTKKKVTKKKSSKRSKSSLPSLTKTKKKNPAKKQRFMSDKDIAYEFATEVHKRFEHIIKASILFGSQARGDAQSSNSDIDIVLIVDDAAIDWDLELIAWYREELAKIIALNEHHKDLHINTVRLTTWWKDLMHGDPVVINILRYGQALIDIGGFFNPIKALLLQGKIHSTPEAVYAALQRAPYHLARSEFSQRKAMEGVYWTMVDSAQAALITLGKLPPSPAHVPHMLDELFVKSDLLKKEYVQWFSETFKIHKAIDYGEEIKLNGVEIDKWQERAGLFMKRMTEIIDMLLNAKNGMK